MLAGEVALGHRATCAGLLRVCVRRVYIGDRKIYFSEKRNFALSESLRQNDRLRRLAAQARV